MEGGGYGGGDGAAEGVAGCDELVVGVSSLGGLDSIDHRVLDLEPGSIKASVEKAPGSKIAGCPDEDGTEVVVLAIKPIS